MSFYTGQSFNEVLRLDEALRVRWLGFPSSFRSSCLTSKYPRSLVWAGPWRLVISCHKNLLQSALSLCRMVLRGLE